MTLLILFIVINLILSFFLEKKNMHAATIAHTVLFIFLLCVLVISTPIELTDSILERCFGGYTLGVMRASLTAVVPAYSVSPVLIAEAAVAFLAILVLCFATAEVIEYYRREKIAAYFRNLKKAVRKNRIFCFDDILPTKSKIYRLNCVMLC